ncbi:MAG: DinB family protein [Acidobacteria bacterium]|nr:DinB family protein [Acidobacteriota bacterium]
MRDSINESSRMAESLVIDYSFSQLTGRHPGGWSAAQCLEHLAKTNLLYSSAIRDALKPAMHVVRSDRRGPIQPGWFARIFLERMEASSPSKFRAPDSVVPAPEADPRAALRDFLGAQRAVVNLLNETKLLNLNGIRFKNPFAPLIRFSAGTGFLLIAAHNRRHIQQARRIADSIPRAVVASSGR